MEFVVYFSKLMVFVICNPSATAQPKPIGPVEPTPNGVVSRKDIGHSLPHHAATVSFYVCNLKVGCFRAISIYQSVYQSSYVSFHLFINQSICLMNLSIHMYTYSKIYKYLNTYIYMYQYFRGQSKGKP